MRKPYTEQELIDEAKNYVSIGDWQRKNKASYNAAWRMKILDKVKPFMKDLLTSWTAEMIHEEALKYTDRFDFQTNSYAAYGAAQRRKIIDLVCSHMKKARHVSGHELDLLRVIKHVHPSASKKKWTKISIPGKPHIKGFEIDIFLSELNLGIEFDGSYFHSIHNMKRSRPHWPEKDLVNYHQIKDDFFISKGIKILHIKEEDWLKDREKCISLCLEFLSSTLVPIRQVLLEAF